MGFEITLTGLDEVIARMDDRIAVLEDLEVELLVGVKEFGVIEGEIFGSGDRGKWAPDTEGTLAYRSQEGLGSQLMHRTGDLEGSLTDPTIFESSPNSVTAGS